MKRNDEYKLDRDIDDPGLNQDSTFDRKDEEDFDHNDDFHKHDDTSKAPEVNDQMPEEPDNGIFDGNINI